MDESIAVAPNEEQGNVSVETETPEEAIEQDTTEAPTEEVGQSVEEAETPTEPEEVLYDLPDGRKVDAETLSREWKDNFLPDYTRKAQALAEKENINKPTDPLADPNYTPANYAELAAQIKAQTLAEIDARESAKVEQQRAIETAVETQLADIKKIDPSFNENALFQHATKYGFRDLKIAHQNMRDMSAQMKAVKQQTAADIAKRNDPVSVSPGATGARPNPSQFATAIEYLNAIKASGK